MKIFGLSLGHQNNEDDLQKAQEYVETQRYSGLTRHYNVEGVQDSIEQKTGVSVTKDEARAIVDAVREQNCWAPATHLG